MKDVFKLMDRGPVPTEAAPAKEFFLVLTNFSRHYLRRQPVPAHDVVYLPPDWASAAPIDKRTIVALFQAFNSYGARP